MGKSINFRSILFIPQSPLEMVQQMFEKLMINRNMVSMLNLEMSDQRELERAIMRPANRGLEGNEPRGMGTQREGLW